jgi:hypothetical protein
MNSPLETGLFLPIRFYNTLAEQNRFKPLSEGVGMLDELYIYADCDKLLPFQILYPGSQLDLNITWRIVCLSTGDTVELPFDVAYWEFYTDLTYYYISYLGKQSLNAYVTNGRSYLELSLFYEDALLNTFYSDIFVVKNCDSFYDLEEYRATGNQSEKRTIDVTNLRITK